MTDINVSLIDLRGISKPASKLIDAVRSAIGIAHEPTRIRRKARADADAIITLAKAQAKSADIRTRARHRLLAQEVRRQANFEAVVRQAVLELPEQVSPNPVDTDWIHHFFGNCADVSDTQMQSLWARILAGEVAEPGSFSRRLLEFIKCLSKQDGKMIDEFYSHVWLIDSSTTWAAGYMTDYLIGLNATPQRTTPYVSEGVRLHMESLGLTHRDVYAIVDRDAKVEFTYLDTKYVSVKNDFLPTEIPIDGLTLMGSELLSVCKPEAVIEYREACVNQYQLTLVTPAAK